MKPIHFIAALFAITVGLLDLVVLTGFRSSYTTPLMLFAGLALGQLALLAFWCVLGGGMGLVRLLAALAAAAGLSHPMARVTGDSWPQWFTLFLLFTACTAGSIALARFLGVRLHDRAARFQTRPLKTRGDGTHVGLPILARRPAVGYDGSWNRHGPEPPIRLSQRAGNGRGCLWVLVGGDRHDFILGAG